MSLAKLSGPCPLRISLNTMKRTLGVDSSIVKSIPAHHSDFVVYGDEVISVEDELKSPYPHEQLLLLSIGVGIKGPLYNRNTHPLFFQETPYNKPCTSESPQFWTQEWAIFYSRVIYDSRKIFAHEFPDIAAMKNIGSFNQVLEDIEDFGLYLCISAPVEQRNNTSILRHIVHLW